MATGLRSAPVFALLGFNFAFWDPATPTGVVIQASTADWLGDKPVLRCEKASWCITSPRQSAPQPQESYLDWK